MSSDQKTAEELSDRYVVAPQESINYGALAGNLPGCGPETFYITTAINYTNGLPHIGHAYEAVTTDIIARYQRVLGKDTYFLTGTDEHGQKIANTAEKLGVTPIELCNKYATAFQRLNQRLLISNDDFIRTTMPYHHETAQRLWQRCADAGDIYLGTYEGWYNEREETFVTEAEAQANDYKDPSTGLPLKRTSEESYFFRMSKYLDQLLAHYEAHPDFLQPETYRNNILARLRKEGLNDLSISRTSFSWGIPVPQGFDQKHVMYVWFDALTNYISGVRGLDPDHELSRYWPASCHIIGKDIIWFHCVIWPCMLLSAGVPLPERVFGHGFVNAADGRKMSKSFGNVIDPHDVLDMVPIDSVRYYICREATYGADLNFSIDSLKLMHNAELADTLGNLVNRATNLSRKYCNEIVPEANYPADLPKPFDLADATAKIEEAMRNNAIHVAAFEAMETMRAANKWLADLAPWNLKGDEHAERRIQITRMALEAIYAGAHLLAPIIPLSAQQIFDRLSTPPRILKQLSPNFDNLAPGTRTTVGDILFVKFEAADAKPAAEEAKAAKAAKQSKKGGSKGKGAKAEEAKAPEDPNQPDFTKIDLRVGRITRVWHHENAEKLFCEEIDIGEATPRSVASGLRGAYTLEEMQDRLVVVVCNLPPRKMQGFESAGMVLASKSGDKVELVTPPEGSTVGSRVFVEGVTGEPHPPNAIKKKKVWEAVAPDLHVNDEGVACYQGKPLQTDAGVCRVATISNAPIS